MGGRDEGVFEFDPIHKLCIMSCRYKSCELSFFVGHPVFQFQAGADPIGISRLYSGRKVAYNARVNFGFNNNYSLDICLLWLQV